jgi:repressor of nif and glnA expression
MMSQNLFVGLQKVAMLVVNYLSPFSLLISQAILVTLCCCRLVYYDNPSPLFFQQVLDALDFG